MKRLTTSAVELAVGVPKPKTLQVDDILEEALGFETFFLKNLGDTVSNQLTVYWAQQIHPGSKLWDAEGDSFENLQDTFLQYVGKVVDPRFARILSRQLAARGHGIDQGLLAAYQRPTAPEWIYCEIASVEASTWRDKRGVLLKLDALTGTPAGNLLRLNVPESWLSFLAYRLGFTRRMRHDDEDPGIFVGFRFMGYLVPRDDSNEPDFQDWFMSPALKKHNTAIIKLRTRSVYGKAECPHDFEDDADCSTCAKTVQECPASFLRRQV